jgi:hypothetical protein
MPPQYNEPGDTGEDHIRNRIAAYLRQQGCEITCVRDKRSKGRDIVIHSKPRRIIEVKGYPSVNVSQGQTKGGTKTASKRRLQALIWLWDAIRQLLEHKATNPSDEIALGVPATEFYLSYLQKFGSIRRDLSLLIYLVSDSDVVIVSTDEDVIPQTR